MEIEEKRQLAKELGIKRAGKMTEETLDKRIQEAQNPEPEPEPAAADELEPTQQEEPASEKPDSLIASELDIKFLKSVGFEFEWLEKLAAQYGLERFEYVHKFKAFRCYKDQMHVDWVDVNDLGLLYAQKQLIINNMMRYQPVSKKRKVIHLPWQR